MWAAKGDQKGKSHSRDVNQRETGENPKQFSSNKTVKLLINSGCQDLVLKIQSCFAEKEDINLLNHGCCHGYWSS